MKNYSEIIASLSSEKRKLLALQLKKKGNVGNFFQLSFSQQRLWFLDQLEPGSPIYNIPMVIRVQGTLKINVLQKSINEIVRRHEVLRTTFAELEGQPIQIIHPDLNIKVPLIDLCELSKEKFEQVIQQLAIDEALLPFDLVQGPLFRTTLIQLGNEDYVVFFTMHHIISDGWSMGVLINELANLYEAYASGRPSPLPALSIQYADFARWQRQRLQGDIMQQQVNYWKEQLVAKSSVLELPTDFLRSAQQGSRGADCGFQLSQELSQKLYKLSNEEGVTIFMVLLAAFKILLQRYSRQDNISIGSPIANRTRAETERLIGFFVNTLVFRTELNGDFSVRELLQQVREVTLDAYAHQDLPFEKLVEIVQPDRNMSHTPLFQVMFVLQNTPLQSINLTGITLSPIKIESKNAEFELTLSISESPQGLSGALQYNSDLFKLATIERMIDNFKTILEQIVANPEQKVDELFLLEPGEQHQVIWEWNNTQTEFDQDNCIQRLIEDQVERTPHHVAVISGEHELTYLELNQRANQLAHYLRKIGVGPDVLVGICMERSLEMIVGLLGIHKAGGAYVPLDPNYPQDRLAFMIEDASVPVLLTQEKLVANLLEYHAHIICLDEDWMVIEEESKENFHNGVCPDNLAYVIYTSGSTGKPKGVLINHRSVVNHNLAIKKNIDLRTEDRVLQFATINFDAAVEEIFPSLMSGATLVLRGPETMISGLELLQLIEKHKLTILDLPTAYWHELVYELSLLKQAIPTSVRLVIVGGDKASIERFTMWQKIGGSKTRWLNTYGPTETTVIATQFEPTLTDFTGKKISEIPIGRPIANTKVHILDENLRPVPVGVPGELYIGGICVARGYLDRPELTAEKFIPDPYTKIPGARLYKSGDLAKYLTDGNIEFIGRVDYQVKVRGFRVELSEIDTILEQHPFVKEAVVEARDMPSRNGEKQLVAYCVSLFANANGYDDKQNDVRIPFPGEASINYNGCELNNLKIETISDNGASLVTISPLPNWEKVQRVRMALDLFTTADKIQIDGDVVWQKGNRIGVAFREMSPANKKLIQDKILQVINDPNVLISELRQYLHRNLPDYMVPAIFVILDKMPKTPSGKVDRQSLPEPDFSMQEAKGIYVAPRNQVEELLANIWSQILGLEKIGVYDNFFELGGHSLIATQLISRIREAFNVELPLRILFEASTIAALAEKIEIGRKEEHGLKVLPLQPVPRAGIMPLSFGQQRLWFLDQLEPNTALYNIPDSMHLKGKLNISILNQCLNEIIKRHEVLRTSFETVDGQAVQRIASRLAYQIPVIDLIDIPEIEKKGVVHQLAIEEHQQPFQLTNAPLFRAKIIRLAEDDHVVLFTMHHIISDGWSSSVFSSEIALLYDHFANGKPSTLPELKIQYADYAFWQREYLKGEVLEKQISYWKNQLDADDSFLELPTDRPRPAVQSSRGALKMFTLPAQLSKDIKMLGQKEGSTLFMTLLAAFQTLLHRYTGQEYINVGTPISNRTRSETEQLIGFFVNTLVIRTAFTGNLRFSKLLKRVKDTTLNGYAHQDVPFEKLVDAIQPQRDMSHSPLFQVMFVLQNRQRQQIELPDLTFNTLDIQSGVSKFDITLIISEEDDKFHAAIEYNTDLFYESTISRMIEHFQILLEGIIANPDQVVSRLPILTENEQKQVLIEWNKTEKESHEEQLIHKLFEVQAERVPNNSAVVIKDQQLTYAELNQRANKLARYLQKLNVGPEVLVGICVERSLDMIVAMMGILKAGGAYVPLDPVYPKERLSYMIEDADLSVLLTHEHLLGNIEVKNTRIVCLDKDWEKIVKESADNLEIEITPENLAYIIYTSGSTGKPKGVQLAHAGVCNFTKSYINIFDLQEYDRVLQFFSYSFDGSVGDIFMTLLSGATLCLVDKDNLLPGPGLIKLMQDHEITTTILPPSVLSVLSGEGLPKLLKLGSGGESPTRDIVTRWAPGRKYFNLYGPTETTVVSATYLTNDLPADAIHVPIGRPMDNTKLYILDSHLNPVPVGIAGELYISGICLARGYLNRPEITADKFIPNPFSTEPGGRMYKTGDLVRYLADGNIEYLGRIDHQVKVRGFRIELGEIESLLDEYPELRESAVIVREDEPGVKRLVAYIVSQNDHDPSISDLRNYLSKSLPSYMIPAIFVTMEALPLTPNGKLDRRALPLPDQSRSGMESDFVAPRSEIEEKLAKIWCQILNLEQVGVNDNFFELGGDSILSIQVVARINQEGLHLTPRQLFQSPTIAGLAEQVERGGIDSRIQAEQEIITGAVPLTPIQHWFFEQNYEDPHHWNQAVFFKVEQALKPSIVYEVVHQLIRHHDALRFRYVQEDNGWQQFNDEIDKYIPFKSLDISDLPESDHKLAIENAAKELQASLNLQTGPIIRIVYFNLGEHLPGRLLIIVNHLAIDGVSWRILLEDIQTAYQQLSSGQKIIFPLKTTSFKHWSNRLSEYAQSPEIIKEFDYWMNIHRKWVPRLPLDFPDGDNTEGSVDNLSVSLSEEDTKSLLQDVPPVYRTQINDVLLTSLIKALTRWTGISSMLIDLEGHGREDLFEDIDISRTVGWFTTAFPVFLQLNKVANPGEELKSIKEQLRKIPHHGFGYGLLRYLNEDAREQLRQFSQAEISFNYLGQIDQVLTEDTFFIPAQESRGADRSARGYRHCKIDVTGIIAGGQLRLDWSFSKNLHYYSTIEKLSQYFVAALRSIIEHCKSPEAGGFTPSDFSLAKLDDKKLSKVMKKINKSKEKIAV